MLQIHVCYIYIAKLATNWVVDINVILLQQFFYNNFVVNLRRICATLIVANHCYVKYIAKNIEICNNFALQFDSIDATRHL